MEQKPKISKAQQQRTNAWNSKAYDRINLTVPKGQREVIEAHAAAAGKSVNLYIRDLISADMGVSMERTKEKAPE